MIAEFDPAILQASEIGRVRLEKLFRGVNSLWKGHRKTHFVDQDHNDIWSASTNFAPTLGRHRG